MTWILSFSDPAALDVANAGGKGASLAALAQAGFAVPGGVIVTPDAFRAFAGPLAEHTAKLAALDPADHDALEQGAAGLRAAARAHPLPAELTTELAAALALMDAGRDARWAVRSSATLEDLAGAAFAGQHDTFLDCIGIDDVRERLRDCWLSLWTPRAVAYRARRGFDHAAGAMAVVVQRLVASEVAGVAFGVDPVGGRLDRVSIDANFGLGESVVSGEAAVDHLLVSKGDWAVVERRTASKRSRIVPTARGTAEVSVDGDEADRPALTDADAAEVARLAVALEAHHGWPQDVEWAFAGGRLWLLQSRAVTAIPPRWTRDESAERFPNAITPLTWDFVEAGFHRSLEHSLRLMGLPTIGVKWFGCFEHYVYGNQNAVELYARRSPLRGLSPAQLGERLPELAARMRWLVELPPAWHAALPHFLARVDALLAEPLERYDLPALWDHVERLQAVGTAYFLPNIAISLGHSLLHLVLHGLVTQVVPAPDVDATVSALVSCETMTTRVNAELRAAARLALADAGLARALAGADARVLWRRHAGNDHPFWRAVRDLVREHGHRETDFDAYHPTWADAPWVVLDQLRVIVAAEARRPGDGGTRSPAADRAALARGVVDALPPGLRAAASQVVELARAYTALDDLEHYHTTRLSRPMRRAVREIGTRLVSRGILDHPLDPFFARRETLARAVAADAPAEWAALAAEVARGRSSYDRRRNTTPAWSLGDAAPESRRAGGSMVGIPGSAGSAVGPVHVVRDVADFARFPHGAVLVAPTTNPAWTPLFYGAAAVVTESGGPLSHGAVTAREVGIPAVMAVRGATTALANGDRVRVDGTTGVVERV